MKVLFINPNWKELVSRQGKIINRPWPPLDLLNCAAVLEKHKISSEILDARARNYSLEYINNKIKEVDLVFITSSPLDRWQCPNLEIEDFISFVNSLSNKEKIFLLGVHPTLDPDPLLQATAVKGVIAGEPEFGVLSVCQNKTSPNIVGPIEVNLEQLPLPAYHKINLDDYYYEPMGKRFALLETARGCPNQCVFCLKVMYGKMIRFKSIQRVKEEIDYTVKKLGAKNIYFFDLEFTLDKSRVREICQYIIQKEYKFHWCCQTRADAVDQELLHLMHKAGCRLIHFGIEAGSQRVLDATCKRISLDKIKAGLKMTRKAGITSLGFFMLGFPGETEEEMKATISFAKEIDPDFASFHAFVPYPGTKIVANNPGACLTPDKNVDKLARKAFRQFYLRPSYILATLLRPKQLLNQLKLFYNFIK